MEKDRTTEHKPKPPDSSATGHTVKGAQPVEKGFAPVVERRDKPEDKPAERPDEGAARRQR
jgi:hypothetical protein